MALVYTSVVVRVIITCNFITFIEGMSGTYEPIKLLTAQFYERPTIIHSKKYIIERPIYSCLHYAIFVIRNALLNVSSHVNVWV